MVLTVLAIFILITAALKTDGSISLLTPLATSRTALAHSVCLTSLNDLVGLEAIMTLVLILLFIGLLIRIFRTKQAISMHQTRIFIHLENSTLSVCKHLVNLNYASDFYKIEIKPAKLTLEQFIIFGYIRLGERIKITNKLTGLNVLLPDKIYIFPQELRQTGHLMANEFFPLLVLIDRNNAQIDVINLSTVDTGTTIGQIEYTGATGQIYPVRALENVMNG